MEKVFESVEEGGTVDVPLKRKCKLMVMYCRSIIWMFSVKTHTCPQQAVDIYVDALIGRIFTRTTQLS